MTRYQELCHLIGPWVIIDREYFETLEIKFYDGMPREILDLVPEWKKLTEEESK